MVIGRLPDDAIVRLRKELAEVRRENDDLHDDLTTALRVRNAALHQAAAHILPGPDGQDDLDRQKLVEEWVDEGHDVVKEQDRQRHEALRRWLAAEQTAVVKDSVIRRFLDGWEPIVWRSWDLQELTGENYWQRGGGPARPVEMEPMSDAEAALLDSLTKEEQ